MGPTVQKFFLFFQKIQWFSKALKKQDKELYPHRGVNVGSTNVLTGVIKNTENPQIAHA